MYGTSPMLLREQQMLGQYKGNIANYAAEQRMRASGPTSQRQLNQEYAGYNYSQIRQNVNRIPGLTAADMASSFMKPISEMLSDLGPQIAQSVGGALNGTMGSFIQAAIKAPTTSQRIAGAQRDRTYERELGMTGRVSQAGNIASLANRSLITANLAKAMMFGAGGPIGSIMGMMSPTMMGATLAAQLGGGLLKARKMAAIQARRGTKERIEKENSLSTTLESQVNLLAGRNEISAADQLKIRLGMWTEAHTSVLPLIFNELKYKNDQKEKNIIGASDSYDEMLYGKQRGLVGGALNSIEDGLMRFNATYNPLLQLSNFILGGFKTPKQFIDELRNYDGDEKKYVRQESMRLGVSSDTFRLMNTDSNQLTGGGDSYEMKMFMLNAGQFDIQRMMVKELLTIRKQGLGVEDNAFYQGPDFERSIFGRMADTFSNTIGNIPGLNAIMNITKTALTLPQRLFGGIGSAFSFGKRALFGQEFLDLQDPTELQKRLGHHKTDDQKFKEFVGGVLPSHLEELRSVNYKQLQAQENIFYLLRDQYSLLSEAFGSGPTDFQFRNTQGKNTDLLVYDAVSGKYMFRDHFEKTLKNRSQEREDMIGDVFGRSLLGRSMMGMEVLKKAGQGVSGYLGGQNDSLVEALSGIKDDLREDRERMNTATTVLNDLSIMLGQFEEANLIEDRLNFLEAEERRSALRSRESTDLYSRQAHDIEKHQYMDIAGQTGRLFRGAKGGILSSILGTAGLGLGAVSGGMALPLLLGSLGVGAGSAGFIGQEAAIAGDISMAAFQEHKEANKLRGFRNIRERLGRREAVSPDDVKKMFDANMDARKGINEEFKDRKSYRSRILQFVDLAIPLFKSWSDPHSPNTPAAASALPRPVDNVIDAIARLQEKTTGKGRPFQLKSIPGKKYSDILVGENGPETVRVSGKNQIMGIFPHDGDNRPTTPSASIIPFKRKQSDAFSMSPLLNGYHFADAAADGGIFGMMSMRGAAADTTGGKGLEGLLQSGYDSLKGTNKNITAATGQRKKGLFGALGRLGPALLGIGGGLLGTLLPFGGFGLPLLLSALGSGIGFGHLSDRHQSIKDRDFQRNGIDTKPKGILGKLVGSLGGKGMAIAGSLLLPMLLGPLGGLLGSAVGGILPGMFGTMAGGAISGLSSLLFSSPIAPLIGMLGGVGLTGYARHKQNSQANAPLMHNQISNSMFRDFGGFRKDGGPVSTSNSYVVGEQGPELFTPTNKGEITPTKVFMHQTDVLKGISGQVQDIIELLKAGGIGLFGTFFGKLGAGMGAGASALGKGLSNLGAGAGKGLQSIGTGFATFFVEIFKHVDMSAVIQKSKDLANSLAAGFGKVIAGAMEYLSKVPGALKSFASMVGSGIGSAFGKAMEYIQKVPAYLKPLGRAFSGLVSHVADYVGKIPAYTKQIAQSVQGTLSTVLTHVAEFAKGTMPKILSGLRSAWDHFDIAITTMADKYLFTPFRNLKSALSGQWDKIKGAGKALWDKITFKGIRTSILSFLSGNRKLDAWKGQAKMEKSVNREQWTDDQFRSENIYYLSKIYWRLGKLTEVNKPRAGLMGILSSAGGLVGNGIARLASLFGGNGEGGVREQLDDVAQKKKEDDDSRFKHNIVDTATRIADAVGAKKSKDQDNKKESFSILDFAKTIFSKIGSMAMSLIGMIGPMAAVIAPIAAFFTGGDIGGAAAAKVAGTGALKVGEAVGSGLSKFASKGIGATLKEMGLKALEKLGIKGLMKGGGTALKAVLKKIPGVGLLVGAGFAVKEAMDGNYLKAILELASGAVSLVPGIGTALSLGIDAINAWAVDGNDKKDESNTSQKKGKSIWAMLKDWLVTGAKTAVSSIPFIGGKLSSWIFDDDTPDKSQVRMKASPPPSTPKTISTPPTYAKNTKYARPGDRDYGYEASTIGQISGQVPVDALKNHIIASEGISLKKYKDSLGYSTIGIGHLIKKDESFPNKIDMGTAMSLFDADYAKHVNDASQLPGFNELDPIRQAALIDMTFNMGPSKVKKFTGMLSALKRKDYDAAADSVLNSRYASQVGARAQRVAELIRSGNPAALNSNQPQVIARNGAWFTGTGTSPIRALLHPNEMVMNAKQFEGALGKLAMEVTKVNTEPIKEEVTKAINRVPQAPRTVTPPMVNQISVPAASNKEDSEVNSRTSTSPELDSLIDGLFDNCCKVFDNSFNDYAFGSTVSHKYY